MAKAKYTRRPSYPQRKSNSHSYSADVWEVTPLIKRKSEYDNHVAWRKTKIAGLGLGVAFMVAIALVVFFWDGLFWESKGTENG